VSAMIINLSDVVAKRQSRRNVISSGSGYSDNRRGQSSTQNQGAESDEGISQFATWIGASGQGYIHITYSLPDCPALPEANYILVRRRADGQRIALRIGCVEHSSASLNLAEIRHRGAQLGANEVHVHLLAESTIERQRAFSDLDAASERDLALALGLPA